MSQCFGKKLTPVTNKYDLLTKSSNHGDRYLGKVAENNGHTD
jgi:hypothetical protein